MKKKKRTKRLGRNESERQFLDMATGKKWRCTKKGWPDFFCKDIDGPFVVEVKRRLKSGETTMLRREQVIILDWFRSLGIRCFVSDGRSMEPYDPEIHAPRHRRYRVGLNYKKATPWLPG